MTCESDLEAELPHLHVNLDCCARVSHVPNPENNLSDNNTDLASAFHPAKNVLPALERERELQRHMGKPTLINRQSITMAVFGI